MVATHFAYIYSWACTIVREYILHQFILGILHPHLNTVDFILRKHVRKVELYLRRPSNHVVDIWPKSAQMPAKVGNIIIWSVWQHLSNHSNMISLTTMLLHKRIISHTPTHSHLQKRHEREWFVRSMAGTVTRCLKPRVCCLATLDQLTRYLHDLKHGWHVSWPQTRHSWLLKFVGILWETMRYYHPKHFLLWCS